MRTVVLGAGNVLLGDEGVGVHAVRMLMKEEYSADVEIIDAGTVGFELLSCLEGAGKVVIVDAVDLSLPPGTVVRIRGDDLFTAGSTSRSAHDSSLLALLGNSPPLIHPARVVVLGVFPADSTTPSLQLSTSVASALPRLLEEIRRELREPPARRCGAVATETTGPLHFSPGIP
jgi:hydrogenase maturation protease